MSENKKNHYSFQKYDTKTRWMSYWHQINEVLEFKPSKVLEVGVGNQVVARYLKSIGCEILTVDIDAKLRPDVIGNILKLPFLENSYSVILCCEVLEHLPFSDFEKGLSELSRVCQKGVILSLPHFGPAVKLCFKTPFIEEKQMAFKIPFLKKHPMGLEHCWEIGKKGYSANKIKKIIAKYFKIQRDFVPFENQYHHFFILEKK